MLAVNKCGTTRSNSALGLFDPKLTYFEDNDTRIEQADKFIQLGLGKPLAISSSHGIATETLIERVSDMCRAAGFKPLVHSPSKLLYFDILLSIVYRLMKSLKRLKM